MRKRLFVVVLVITLGLWAAACGGGGDGGNNTTPAESKTPSSSTAVAVTIRNFDFAPASITVKAGTMVTWTNQDGVSHPIAADDGSWKSGDMGSGKTFSRTFAEPGTFSYHCTVHPQMKGKVQVTP